MENTAEECSRRVQWQLCLNFNLKKIYTREENWHLCEIKVHRLHIFMDICFSHTICETETNGYPFLCLWIARALLQLYWHLSKNQDCVLMCVDKCTIHGSSAAHVPKTTVCAWTHGRVPSLWVGEHACLCMCICVWTTAPSASHVPKIMFICTCTWNRKIHIIHLSECLFYTYNQSNWILEPCCKCMCQSSRFHNSCPCASDVPKVACVHCAAHVHMSA